MSDISQKFEYFKRDLSWLSFNYRVLLEAEDDSLPIFERIKFLSIYSSNLEEFYEIRVAGHMGVAMKRRISEAEDSALAEATLAEITAEVNRQQYEYHRIFYEMIIPELFRNRIFLYHDSCLKTFHEDFVREFFTRDIFPFLSPVMIRPGEIRTFIRDRRLYLVVRMRKKDADDTFQYAIMKIPFSKVPRFIKLPEQDGVYYIMFIDDVIRANLGWLFPAYTIDSCYSIKLSRDADIELDDLRENDIVADMRQKLRERKNGYPSRVMYDSAMPADFLNFICEAFDFTEDHLVAGARYMNLADLRHLPNPIGEELEAKLPYPMRIPLLERASSVMDVVNERDVLLHFPYQSFDYLIRILKEAATDPNVVGIKITQYRVAEHSEVINQLIAASRNGKDVRVYVEIKARFDEENNMFTAEQMEQAGIHIIYSNVRLKVHAKIAHISRCLPLSDIACISTGNFNEKTAGIYSDIAMLTSNAILTSDVAATFAYLDNLSAESIRPVFKKLLVARCNMVDELRRMIMREANNALAGRRAHIVLKMNGLHDKEMIDMLYVAGQAGVRVDLIVRGICCLMPGQSFSPNISVTRIVDMYLEHARIWYFYNSGNDEIFISSADWMHRNLNRRIEAASPILDPVLKQEIRRILNLQLQDNVKACVIDEHMNNVRKTKTFPALRSQTAVYEYLKSRV
ncbi:MAG: polyphosphate kinase 1 [Tannerellaceae bacterium]|jgi:polyphosphate kinase|nr:polyphosphate kinase 1 [Tannerellaceae bacterium]